MRADRFAFVLYAKDRHLVAFLIATVTLSVVTYLLGRWLIGLHSLDPREARTPLTVLVPIVAMIFASATLTGGSPTQEAICPRLSARFRCLHATSLCAMAAAALGLSLAPDVFYFGSLTIVRNTLGIMGLMLVCQRLHPVASWAIPALYILVTYMAASGSLTASSPIWAWPAITAEASFFSWLLALGLVAVGLGLYASPKRATQEGRA